MNIKGAGIYTDASGESHKIILGDLPDSENLRALKVSGNLTFKKISCDEINVSGKCEGGSITAQSLKVSGGLSFDKISCEEGSVSGKCEGKSLTAKNFSASGKVEIDSLKVEETLKLSGKPRIDSMTATKIFIDSIDGSIGSIKCRTIKIFDRIGLAVTRNLRVRIVDIDADKVELENCAVVEIKCKDAFIGVNCVIEKLFVSGECEVADGSTIGETIRT